MFDDIKKTLWPTADKLRANMDAAEYKHIVLGIFVKYILDTFQTRRDEILQCFGDAEDDYFIPDAKIAEYGRVLILGRYVGTEPDILIRERLGALGYAF